MNLLGCSEQIIGNSVPLQQGVLCEQLELLRNLRELSSSGFCIRSQRDVIGRHNCMLWPKLRLAGKTEPLVEQFEFSVSSIPRVCLELACEVCVYSLCLRRFTPGSLTCYHSLETFTLG